MRLREKTRAPGRYREEDDDQNWNDPKPIFVCPTITYNPTLPEAAFPTIPLGEYPPLQPTETPASDKDTIMEGDQANPSQAQLVRRWPVNRLTHPQMFKKPPRWEAVGQPGEFTFGAVHDYDEDQNASQHMGRHPNIIGYYDDGTRDLEEEYNGWYAKAFEQPDGTTEDRFRMKTYGKQFEWHDLSDAMKLILVRELLRFMPLRKISDYLQWTRDDDRYFVDLYNKGARSRQREEDVIAYFNECQTRLLMSGKLDLQKDWNAIFEQEVRQLRGGGAVFSIGQQDLVPVTHLLSALKTREEFPQDWKDRENILTKQELNVIARRLYGYLEFQTSFSDLGFQHKDMFDEIDALDNMPAQRGAEDGDTTDDDEDIPAEVPSRRANSGWTRPPPPHPAASSPLGAEQPDGSRKTVRHIKPYRPSGMPSKIVTLKGMQPTALRQVLNADEVDETEPPVRDNNQRRASINTDEPGIIIRNSEKDAAYQSGNTTVETPPITKRVPKPSQKAAKNGSLPGLPQSQQPQSQKIPSAGSTQEVTPSRRVNIRLIVTPTKHADQPQKKSESKSAIANEATKSNSNKLESFGKPLKSISEEPSKQNINHSGASGFVPRGNAQQHHKPDLGLHTAAQHPPGDITRFRRPEDVPQDLTVVIPNNKRPSTATVPGSQVVQSSTSTSPTRSILNSAVNYGLPTKEDAALPGTTSTTNPHSEGKTLKVGTGQIPQPMPSLLPSLYAAMHNSILNTPFIPIMGNTTAAQGQPPQAQSAQSNKYHNRVRDFAVLVKTNVDPKQKPIPAPQGIRQSQEGQSTPLQFSPATVTKNGFSTSLNASITQNQDVISRHKSSSDHRTSGAAISQNFSSMAPPFSMVSNLPQYSVPNHSKLPDPFSTQSPMFPRPGVSGFPHPGTFVNQLPSNSPFDVLSQSPMPIAQAGDMDTLRLQTTTPTNPSLSQQSTETSNDLIDPALLSSVPFNAEQHLLERQHESRIRTSTLAELMIPNRPPNAVPVRHARATSSKQSVMHQPATVQPTVPNLSIAKPNVNASSEVDESIQAPKSGLKVASGKKQALGPLETKDTTSSQPQSIISEAGATVPAVGRGKPSINSTVPAPNNKPSSAQIQSAPFLKSAIQLITTNPPTESNEGDNSISQPLDTDVLAELSTDTIRSASTKGKEPDVGSDKVTIGGGKSKKTNPKTPDAGLSDVLLATHAEVTSQSNSLNVGVTKSIAEAKYATMEDLELPPSALNAGPSASQSQSGDSQLKKKQVGVGHSKANNTNKRGIEPLDPIPKAAKPPTKKPKKTPSAKPAQPKKNEAAAKPESSKPEVPVPNNPFSGTIVAPLPRSNTGSAAGMEGVTIQAQVKTPSRTATMKTTPTSRLSPEAAFFTPPENRSPQRSPPKVAFNLDRVMTDDGSPTRKRKGKGPMIPTMVDGAGPPATLSSKKNENKKAQNSAVTLETGASSATETKGPATKSSEEVIEEDAAIKPPPVPKSIKAPKHIATRKLPVPKPKEKMTLLTKADAARPTGPSLLEQIEAQEAAQSAEEAAQKVLGAPPPILEQRSRSAAKTAKDARGSAPASPVKSEGKKKTTTGSGKLDALLGNLETGSAGSQKGGKGGAAPEKAHTTRSMPTIDGFLKGKEKPSSDGGSVDELASSQEGMVGTGRRPMTRSEDVATDPSRQPTAVIEAGSISGTTPQDITRKRGSTGLLGDVPRPAKRQRTASISASVSAEPTPKPAPTIQAGASAIRHPPKPKASPKPKTPAKAKTPSTRSATPVSTASRAPTPKSTPVGKATTKKAPAKPKAPTPSTNGSSKAPAKKAATPAVKTPTVRPATKKKTPAAKAAPAKKTMAKGK